MISVYLILPHHFSQLIFFSFSTFTIQFFRHYPALYVSQESFPPFHDPSIHAKSREFLLHYILLESPKRFVSRVEVQFLCIYKLEELYNVYSFLQWR